MIRIYYTPVVLLVINKKINFDLSNLVQWLRANKVDLHVNQIDIVIFWSPRKQITKKWTYVWVVRKLVVRRQSCHKYLGVLLDEQISSHQNKKAWSPFYHKKYFSHRVSYIHFQSKMFYDKMDWRLFYFDVAICRSFTRWALTLQRSPATL